MKCPHCKSDQLTVVDTRTHQDGIHRRRNCLVCGNRFNTIEIEVVEHERLLKKVKNWDKLRMFIKSL